MTEVRDGLHQTQPPTTTSEITGTALPHTIYNRCRNSGVPACTRARGGNCPRHPRQNKAGIGIADQAKNKQRAKQELYRSPKICKKAGHVDLASPPPGPRWSMFVSP